MKRALLVMCIVPLCWGPQAAHGVQTLSNPLIKPQPPAAATAEKGAAEDARGRQSNTDGADSKQSAEDLKRQAERRLTQEDLNIRQQQLNSPVVPVYLQNLFEQMSVVGYFRGAVVLRRQSQKISSGSSDEPKVQAPSSSNTSTSPNNGNPNTASTVSPPASPPPTRDAMQSAPALRLQVGRITNLNGYRLRASVMGQDVSVDWQDEAGRWGNVFLGVMQSTSGLNPVPRAAQLETLQTGQFNYLKPQVGGASLSGGSGMNGNNAQGMGGFGSTNGSSPFGQTGGGFGSSPSNGFR